MQVIGLLNAVIKVIHRLIRTSSIVTRMMPRIVLTSGSDGDRDPTPIARCEPWYKEDATIKDGILD